MVTKTKKENSSDCAYNAILNGITTGALKSGLMISEHDLSETYGIGRTPIREALKRLEGEGFIVNKDRKRHIYYLTVDDIRQIFDLKIAIEGMVAYHAARSDAQDMMDTLKDIIHEMEKYTEGVSLNTLFEHKGDGITIDNWLDLDKRFHNLLYNMADNNRARIIIDNLNTQWHRIRIGMSAITGHLEKSVFEHLRVGYAILAHEPENAQAAIVTHFQNLKKYIIGLMETFAN